MNAGFDPGKDGEKIRSIKPVLDQGEGDDPRQGVKWWPDEDDD